MKGTENKKDRMREEVLEQLFQHASARERPPHETEQAIRASLHGQWKDATQGRRRWQKRWLFAAAASILIAVFAGSALFRSPLQVATAIEVASVEVIRGNVSVDSTASGAVASLDSLGILETGQQVSTAHEAGFSALWQNGIAIRVDQNSRIRIISQAEIQLVSGRVYVDTSRADSASASLFVSTPAGPVRHVGTRYMIAVNLGSTSVSVREGQVLFGDDQEAASSGERLVLTASGERRREVTPVYGDNWHWTENLVQPFDSNGRTVAEFLTWVERESGRTVQYASPAALSLAAETRLRGEIDLGPMPALALVMQSTDLQSQVVQGTILVSQGSPP